MNFGNYYIGQNVTDIASELKEFSPAEYSFIKPFFNDEKIYNGNEVEFCDTIWTTVIGITEGKVYKISLLFSANLSDKSDVMLWDNVINTCNNELSASGSTKGTEKGLAYTWEVVWGNLIFRKDIVPEGGVLNFNIAYTLTATGQFAFVNTSKRYRGISKSGTFFWGGTLFMILSAVGFCTVFFLNYFIAIKVMVFLFSTFWLLGSIRSFQMSSKR